MGIVFALGLLLWMVLALIRVIIKMICGTARVVIVLGGILSVGVIFELILFFVIMYSICV